MEKRIITISREFGSGGRFIGEEVAKKLGIAYYDKSIINEIAEKSGLSPEYIKENAELSPKKGLFAYAFAGRDITGKSVEDMVYEAQRKMILDIAEKEPCVIIGRNADYILKDREDVLNVFIHGNMPEKIQRIGQLYHVGEKEAAKMLADTDKRRMTNYNLSNQSSETLVFSRKIGILILVPYVFSLVFALMSRNKGNFLFRFPRPPYQAVLRKFVSLPS